MLDLTHWADLTPQQIAIISIVAPALVTLLGILVGFWYYRRQLRMMLTRQGLQQESLLIEQRQLSDQNLDLTTKVEIFYEHGPIWVNEKGRKQPGSVQKPFVVGTFDIQNTGDGPLDLVAMLVSGRELAHTQGPGLGTRGRDVAWDDLKPYYWNTDDHAPILRGISTTKQAVYDADQLIRLDHTEHESLNRIDALANVDELYRRGHLNLVYKVFIVVLNYPLGIFVGKLNRSPGSRIERIIQEVGSPNFHRWSSIQRALETINSLPFRLALEQQERIKGMGCYAADPVGRLTTSTAWRCFLLHHWDFADLDNYDSIAPAGDATPDPIGKKWRALTQERKSTADVRNDIRESEKREGGGFNVYRVDPPPSGAEWKQAREYCYKNLGLLLEAWDNLNATIDLCAEQPDGFAELVSGGARRQVASRQRGAGARTLNKEKTAKESAEEEKRKEARKVECQKRWEALRTEGYLYRPRRTVWWRKWLRLPPRPLTRSRLWAIERYRIGAKFALVTLRAPGHDNPERFGRRAHARQRMKAGQQRRG